MKYSNIVLKEIIKVEANDYFGFVLKETIDKFILDEYKKKNLKKLF